MGKIELEILKIGFEAGKKAIEMHPDDDEYDSIRFNEALVLAEIRIKELEDNTTELITEREDVFSGCFSEITKTKCCGIAPITNENFCPNCGKRIVREEL